MQQFGSFAEFADYLRVQLRRSKDAMLKSLEESCVLLEATAKAKFGHYQDAIGPYNKWAPLDQSTREQRVRAGYTPDDPLFRDGTLLKDSIKHAIDPVTNSAVVGSDELVMVYQELGTSRGIPPRPVLGPTGFECGPKVAEIFATNALAIVGVKDPKGAPRDRSI